MSFATVLASPYWQEDSGLSTHDMGVVFVVGCIVATITLVFRTQGTSALETGAWVAWQQAHTAVRIMLRRFLLRAVIAAGAAFALNAVADSLFALVVGMIALDGLIAAANARYVLSILDRPQVRIERRGNWLLVQGPRWVHCSDSAWERATAVTAASAGLRRRD